MHCNIHCRFPLGNSIVVLLKSDQDLEQCGQSETSSGKPIVYVAIGSHEHISALKARITELVNIINSEPGHKLAAELEQRKSELDFVMQQVKRESSELDGSLDESASLEPSITEEDNVISVTSETFHAVQQLKLIKVLDNKQQLFKKPKIRQYYVRDVLHREKEDPKVTSYDLFLDLVYVGCVSKAGHLISVDFSWKSLYNFFLIYSGIFVHWITLCIYSNSIYHEDMVNRFLLYFLSSTLVLMGVSIHSAFSVDPAINTGNIFIFNLILSRIGLLLAFVFVSYHCPKFRPFILGFNVAIIVLSTSLYVPILFLPVNGQVDRLNLREKLWGAAACISTVAPFIFGALSSNLKYRLASNIEHITQRYSSLIVIVLGEIVVGFLYDRTTSEISDDLGYIVASMIVASNIYYLYYRSESASKHVHAIRRGTLSAIVWNITHLPLSAAIVAVGDSLNGLIAPTKSMTPELKTQLQITFTTSLSSVFFCLGILHSLHKEYYSRGDSKCQYSPNLSQKVKTVIRLILAILFLVLGLTLSLSGDDWIVIALVTTTVATAIEEYGNIQHKQNNKN